MSSRLHLAAGLGDGRSRPYASAWDRNFGLMTGECGQLILRLDGGADRAAFLGELSGDPRRLVLPEGIGRDLFMTPKSISLSGSLPHGDWKVEAVRWSVALGWPLFPLPHFAETPLEIGNRAPFTTLAMI